MLEEIVNRKKSLMNQKKKIETESADADDSFDYETGYNINEVYE